VPDDEDQFSAKQQRQCHVYEEFATETQSAQRPLWVIGSARERRVRAAGPHNGWLRQPRGVA
jgi:hypothetical protein